MHRWRGTTFFLILAIGNSIAETVKNVQGYTTLPESVRKATELQADTGKLDYESALRPAVLQKRSIANIARLLLGGNVPPNHPLVKYPEPKSWNLANNIMNSLQPGSSALMAAASSQHEGWSRQPSNALQNIQHLFETKAKIIPYTGQVATGLTGLASVKGDLIRQIHSISTQAIAQAAAEAAARALASAAAAHAVTNSIAHSVNPGAQTGIKGGWSSYQNAYAEPLGKTPGEQPGPPYQDSSAHINHYQPPPASFNPYAIPATTPSPVAPTLPPPPAYQTQPQQYQSYPQSYPSQPQNPQSYPAQSQQPQPYPAQSQQPQAYPTQPPQPQAYPTQPPHPQPYPTQPQQPYENGYYTLYNTQQSTSNARPQTPYTPAPPVPHARPTLSPNTLIATTPSGYSPSLSKPLLPSERRSKALPVIVYAPGSNNTPLTSFRRAVPAGIFGRNAAQPSSTSSLLSSISSLLSASTAAYNAAFTGANGNQQQQQQSAAVFSTLLPSESAPHPATSVHRPTSSITSHSPSLLSSGIGSSAYNNNAYQQQSANSVSQGGGNYGGVASGSSIGYFQHSAGSTYPSEARAASVNSPSYSFNQHVSGNSGTNYAQPGGNPYASQSVQPSSQFGSGPARPTAASGVANNGVGVPGYSTPGNGYNPGPVGSGYPGYNGGAGPSAGHASGWNTQHAGPSASASSWPGGSNVYTPGYASQTPGNINNSPGGFGGPAAAQFPVAAGSAVAQQTYSAPPANAYQPPAPNHYAQAQQVPYAQQSPQLNGYPNGYQTTSGNSNSIGGFRNSNLGNRYESQDLRQSASTMGNDYDEEDDDVEGDEEAEEEEHHNYQQAQRRNRLPPKKSYSSSRYPSPSKKRPTKRPTNNNSYGSNTGGNRNNNQQNRNHNSNSNQHARNHNGNSNQHDRNHNGNSNQHERNHNGNSNQINKNKHGNNVRKDVSETGKRVIPTGPKKGSQFDSVDVVDASVDGFSDGDRYSQSDEIRNDNNDPDTNKNRWRTKNSSGQRPNSFHNHNSNGRWSGKTSYSKQAPPKNVRGNGDGSERPRPQPEQSKGGPGKNFGSKKVPPKHERQQEKKQQPSGKPKTEAAHLYRGRLRPEQQRRQPQPPTTTVQYKSRDVYTTLPEYVFRVGERPDVFLRPGGKHRKQRIPFRGRGALNPRLGETDGSGSNRRSDVTEEETLDTSSSKHIYDEANTREDYAETNLEKSSDAARPLLDQAAGGGEEEEFISASEAIDETSRTDILSDQMASNSGFLTSEELDPEEREAFVDDVYADEHEHGHHPLRRQDYDEEGIESPIQAMSEENEDDFLDKK